MASLLDKLVEAGLQPLDAQEVITMLGDGFAFPLDRKALIQSARRGWWASEKVSNSYKRLLDATLARSDEPAGEIDIIKAWRKQLLRLADADLLTDDLGLMALGRQVEMVGGALPDLSLDAVIKTYRSIEDGESKQLIAAYLDCVLDGEIIKGGPGSGNHGHDGIPGHQGGSKPKRGRSLNRIRRDTDDSADLAEQKKVFDYLNNGDDWQVKQPIDQDTLLYAHEPPEGRAEALKDSVAKALAKDLGVSESLASDFIHDWAVTSNGFHLASLTHQRLAAERFGSTFTEWQQGRLFEAASWRKQKIKMFAENMFASGEALDANEVIDKFQTSMRKWEDLSLMGSTYPFESKMLEELAYGDSLGTMRSADEFIAFLKGTEEKSLDLTRKAIESVYRRTQQDLAANGITSLTLYRGLTMPYEGEAASYSIGKTILATSNALSSWSASEHVSDTMFAKVETGKRRQTSMGVVQVVDIPASRVYASPRTGHGCLADWEFILIGSEAPEEMQVLTTYQNERRTMYKAAIIKGGPGSGNFGHDGRPGQRGGSADDGINNDEGSSNKDPAPGTDTDTGITGMREGWAEYKLGLMCAYAGPGDRVNTNQDLANMLNKRIDLIDELSQDERVDLLLEMARTNEIDYMVRWNDEVKAAIAKGDMRELGQALLAHEKAGGQLYGRDRSQDQVFYNLLACRLDVPHAEKALAEITKQNAIGLEKAPNNGGEYINYDQYRNFNLSSEVPRSLFEFGPTHEFRVKAYETSRQGKHKWLSTRRSFAILPVDENGSGVQALVNDWTLMGGGTSNAWAQAGVMQEFGGVNRSMVYFHPTLYGVILNDPDPNIGKAARAIYEKTQAFYAKKKKTSFPVFRGVAQKVTVRSPIESWSLSKTTAYKFDGEAVFEREANVSEIFMSWESMKGIFPEEKQLRGKKELVLFGLDWLNKR